MPQLAAAVTLSEWKELQLPDFVQTLQRFVERFPRCPHVLVRTAVEPSVHYSTLRQRERAVIHLPQSGRWTLCPLSAFSRAVEQLRFVLQPNALLHLRRVVAVLRVAAEVAKHEVRQIVAPARGAAEDLLDSWAEVMTGRKVEAQRALAPAASVAVAAAKLLDALLVLVAPELPRIDEADDVGAAHGADDSADDLPCG